MTKERPILFSAPMVRAILDGSKTQTRRVVKLPVEYSSQWSGGWHIVGKAVTIAVDMFNQLRGKPLGVDPTVCPYGQPGDRLWVREAYADIGPRLTYRADENDGAHCMVKKWTPSIHMFRADSRILLEIVSVRVERLHDLSEGDAIAEGIERMPCAVPDTKLWKNYNPGNGCTARMSIPQNSFRSLWESINGEENWLSNPFVWVVEFKRVTP